MIKARLIIEAQGNPKDKVEKALDDIVKQIEKVTNVEIYDVKKEKVLKDKKEEFHSGLIDVGIQTEKIEVLFFVVLRFGPTAIIVLEPDDLKITMSELQSIINDMSNVLHGLATDALRAKLQLAALTQQKKQ